MTTGLNIAKLRRQKNWTQAELAERTNLSLGYIAAIEEGKAEPTIKTLAILAHNLGVSLEELHREEET